MRLVMTCAEVLFVLLVPPTSLVKAFIIYQVGPLQCCNLEAGIGILLEPNIITVGPHLLYPTSTLPKAITQLDLNRRTVLCSSPRNNHEISGWDALLKDLSDWSDCVNDG